MGVIVEKEEEEVKGGKDRLKWRNFIFAWGKKGR